MADIRIDKIVIRHIPDENPDLSWIGKYSDTPEKGAIDRKERRDTGRGQYRYFNPANPEYAEEDYRRMEAYNRDEWGCIGIIAEAEVSYPIPDEASKTRRLEWLKSSGLWGIASDDDPGHIRFVEIEQLLDLKIHLEAFGIPCPDLEEMRKLAVKEVA